MIKLCHFFLFRNGYLSELIAIHLLHQQLRLDAMLVRWLIQPFRPQLTIGKVVFSGSYKVRKQFAATSFKAAHKLQSMECVGSFPADRGARLQVDRVEKLQLQHLYCFPQKSPPGNAGG